MALCLFRKDHEKAEFEVHEVYAVDVLISTGEGKVRGKHPSFQHGKDVRLKHLACSKLSCALSPGQRLRTEDHHLQAGPHQAVRAEDEDFSDVLQ